MPRDRSSIRRDESQRVVGFFHDAETALVQHSMVIRAQQRHVVGARLTAVDPMRQVMPIEIPLVMTARERAAAIACVQCALQRRRHRALLATDVERIAVGILGDQHRAAIAQ